MRKRADSLAFVPKDGIKCKETVFRAGDNCPNTAFFFSVSNAMPENISPYPNDSC